MNLQLQAGYFSITNPFQLLDRWLNPFHLKGNIDIRGKKMDIMYSRRAEKALSQRSRPLIAELQLYFTCVVQKRVNFHDKSEFETIKASPLLEVIYHTVQSDTCDPVEFNEKHPVKQELNSKSAQLMRPSYVQIDFKNGEWLGDFSI